MYGNVQAYREGIYEALTAGPHISILPFRISSRLIR
jgi:hypothetical protein